MVSSIKCGLWNVWDGPESIRRVAWCVVCTWNQFPALLCVGKSRSDTQDVPSWLFLKGMVQGSSFCLYVKTGICGLQLRDVATQILPGSLGCSLGNDYVAVSFPLCCCVVIKGFDLGEKTP